MEEVKTKRKKTAWEIIAWILACIFVFVGLVFITVRLCFRLPNSSYYNASAVTFEIPGTGDGFVAQGFDYDAGEEQFLVTGYMKDHSASPLYLVGHDGKIKKTVYFTLPDGSAYCGHGGGIAQAGEYIYLTGDTGGCLYLFRYDDVCAAENGSSVAALDTPLMTAVSEEDYIGTAFVYDTEDYLIVGEFYREGNYPTPDSHKLTTAAGDYQQAVAIAFRRDATQSLGVDPTPIAAISLPDQVQGMAVAADRVYLSTSWGLSRSHILTYDTALAAASQQGEITLLGHELPLYAFDSASMVSDSQIPPMSEELVVLEGRLYVMCESASDKYIFGKFTGGQYCYATELNFFG